MRGVLVLLAGGLLAAAQAQEFEVASVRAAAPADGRGVNPVLAVMMNRPMTKGGPGTADPERLTITHTPLRMLLFQAFGVRPDQISGPEWLESAVYDITAKLAPGTTVEQMNVMMQHLLLERFKIELHHTTGELPVYELTVAKKGAKLKEVVAVDEAAGPKPGEYLLRMEVDSSGFPVIAEGRRGLVTKSGEGLNRVTCRACTVAELIKKISIEMAAPSSGGYYVMAGRVVDHTGLGGSYDFHLEYAGEPVAGGALQGPATDAPAAGPDLYAALEKQLGLKLEKTKAPMDVMVIDRIERVPSEN